MTGGPNARRKIKGILKDNRSIFTPEFTLLPSDFCNKLVICIDHPNIKEGKKNCNPVAQISFFDIFKKYCT